MAFKLGLDLDNTITAAPNLFKSLAQMVKDGGGEVHVVHGASKDGSPEDDTTEVRNQLSTLGFDGLYDTIYVAPRPRSQSKAAYAKDQGLDLLVDNRLKNAMKTAEAGTPAAHFLT